MTNTKTVDFDRFAMMVSDTIVKCKRRKNADSCLAKMPFMFGQQGQSVVRTIILVNYQNDRSNDTVSRLTKTLSKTHNLWIVTNIQGVLPLVDGDTIISIGAPTDKEFISVTLTEIVEYQGQVTWLTGVVKDTGEVELNWYSLRPLLQPIPTGEWESGQPTVERGERSKDTTLDYIEGKLKRLQWEVKAAGASLHIFMDVDGYDHIVSIAKKDGVGTVTPECFGNLCREADKFVTAVEKAGYEINVKMSVKVHDASGTIGNGVHTYNRN